MAEYQDKTSPYFGEVKYDNRGYPICGICGKSYRKVLSHVWQKHGIFEKDYKQMFGLDLKKGICCQETREMLQEKVKKNYESVVVKNLLNNGTKTRFKKGGEGRTFEKVSEQTKRRLETHGHKIGKAYYKFAIDARRNKFKNKIREEG